MSSTTPKGKKSSSIFKCTQCNSVISHKDASHHSSYCPPPLTNLNHNFAKGGYLYATLEMKSNDDIKGILPHDRDNLVFLSMMGMQICDFTLGSYVLIADLQSQSPPCARIVWPTMEKSVISACLTKEGIEGTFGKAGVDVCISNITFPIYEAEEVTLVNLSNIKNLEIHSDLLNRISKTYLNRILTVGNRVIIRHYGRLLKFTVRTIKHSNALCTEIQHCTPTDDECLSTMVNEVKNLSIGDTAQFCKVTNKSRFSVFKDESHYQLRINQEELILKIGGLNEEIAEIRNIMMTALGKSNMLSPATVTRGVLLYGSLGCGKTLLAKALCQLSGINVIELSIKELYSGYDTNVEETVAKLLTDAVCFPPSIVHIDEIDAFCPAKTARLNDSDKKVMANILCFFDKINNSQFSNVFVIATSNKPDNIDSAFRRCGRLDREIEIPTPDPKGRLDILRRLLLDVPTNMEQDDLKQIATNAHGFVGSDLVALCSRAALQASKWGNNIISLKDMQFALTRVRPSAMREVYVEVPDVKWSDIGGQDKLKLILRQSVEWPLKYPESFIRIGIAPPRGVLMFGPPGCSKTMIAKALATESGLNFLSIKGPELFSKWVGESERAVREVFRKARQVAPSIIFFDEIDALGGERSSGSSTSVQERVLAQLLTEMDGVTALGDVTVLAATNRPDRIDKALLRPGRLDRIVHVPLPDDYTRREIFKIKLSKMPIAGIDLEFLVKSTAGYSGAEVNAVCHEAGMKALEEDIKAKHVTLEHFKKALDIVIPRTSDSLLEIYDDYTKR